jgi:hypothetical protein
MSLETLKYLSEPKLTELREKVHVNYDRYTKGNFLDLTADNGWSIELGLKVDLDRLKGLDPRGGPRVRDSAECEIKNALLVWSVFEGLSPALATEERIWARLTHLECLEFTRKRWLDVSNKDEGIKAINKHFFASTQTGVRDDNSVSRLWWGAYIAKLAMPDDHETALKTILSKADIRSNLVERSRTGSRPVLAAAIIRAMVSDPRIAESEDGFREFMKIMNRMGGGELFEVMPVSDVDRFIKQCADRARAAMAA